MNTPKSYVYICRHTTTNHFYIGYREKNISLGLHADVDLPLYKTSSKIVNPDFHNYTWEIIAEFENGENAYDYEQKLIFENWNNPLLLNKSCRHNSTKRFKSKKGADVTAETRAKIVLANTGRKLSEETKKKISNKAKGRTPWNKGKSRGPMSDEQKRKISESGKGLKKSDTTKQLMTKATYKKLRDGTHPSQKLVTCPHCLKTVKGTGNATRWHFDRCKSIL